MHNALTPNLPGFLQAIAPTINHYGYFAVGGLVLIEDFGIPVPGETVLIASAVFASVGQLNIMILILVAFIAALIGDNIGFAIGSIGGRPLVEKFGKYIFLTPARLDKAEGFFNRNGGKVVIVARFIEGLRQANGIVAGISEMRWRAFITYNAIGAALWVMFWSLAGYFGGSHISTIYSYGIEVSIIALILIIIFIIYKLVKRKLKNN